MKEGLKPTDKITVTVDDFESNYVSRQAYETLRAKILENDLRRDKLIGDLVAKTLEMANQLATLTSKKYGPETADGWIPVTESLPEYGKRVLFATSFGEIGIAYHIDNIPQWSSDAGYYYQGQSYGSITHWMPLPEPPEAKE